VLLIVSVSSGHGNAVGALFPLVLFAAFGFVLFRVYYRYLVDSVLDDGSALIIKRGDLEERVPYPNITNIGYAVWSNVPAVIHFRVPTSFGEKASFMPRGAWPPQRRQLIEDLIKRIDAARRGPSGSLNV